MKIDCMQQASGGNYKISHEFPTKRNLFLDVELKNEPMDGFGLGKIIRETDPRGFIIYVTAFEELAFETFRYHLEALDYIIKGDMEKMLNGIKAGA